MARLPRLTLAGYPHSILQRGNNGQSIFSTAEDYESLLAVLEENAKAARVAVHAYVLMSNQMHLLATPETSQGVPQMMQALGRSYVRYFNSRHSRTGTLWEGRYRSTLIQPDRYLLPCMVSMDLAPVRAGLVAHPGDYPWSSHLHYVGRMVDKRVTPHPLYWSLGNTPFAREHAYADLVHAGIDSRQQQALTDATFSGWALGGPEFVAEVQRRTGRRVEKAKAGRPRVLR